MKHARLLLYNYSIKLKKVSYNDALLFCGCRDSRHDICYVAVLYMMSFLLASAALDSFTARPNCVVSWQRGGRGSFQCFIIWSFMRVIFERAAETTDKLTKNWMDKNDSVAKRKSTRNSCEETMPGKRRISSSSILIHYS